jgi:hypothetical protein
MSELHIEFQSTIASQPTSALSLRWPKTKITAGELISLTVSEQCRQLAEQQQIEQQPAIELIARQYLSEADIARLQQEGRIAFPTFTSDFDAAAAIRLALEAFRRRRFLLLVDERQINDEHEVIILNAKHLIRFFRLIPLKGG